MYFAAYKIRWCSCSFQFDFVVVVVVYKIIQKHSRRISVEWEAIAIGEACYLIRFIDFDCKHCFVYVDTCYLHNLQLAIRPMYNDNGLEREIDLVYCMLLIHPFAFFPHFVLEFCSLSSGFWFFGVRYKIDVTKLYLYKIQKLHLIYYYQDQSALHTCRGYVSSLIYCELNFSISFSFAAIKVMCSKYCMLGAVCTLYMDTGSKIRSCASTYLPYRIRYAMPLTASYNFKMPICLGRHITCWKYTFVHLYICTFVQ